MSKKETKIYAGMPLAARLRPRNLAGFIGQEKIIRPGSFLYKAIETDEVVAHFVGTARFGQDDFGFNHRQSDQGGFHRILCRRVRQKRIERRDQAGGRIADPGRAHRITRNACDAGLFAQQIEGLNGFFRQADDAFRWKGHVELPHRNELPKPRTNPHWAATRRQGQTRVRAVMRTGADRCTATYAVRANRPRLR